MANRPCGSTSQSEPSLKKAKRGSEVEVLTQMPEVVPPSAEEQEEEEEEEEEEVPTLRSRGLRSRGLAILAEGEPVGEPVMTEGVERPEVDLVEMDDVEISRVSTQPGPSSTQERREEVQ